MKLQELKRGPKDNTFCGPAVISFITGLSTTEAARAITLYTGATNIRGTYLSEVCTVLSNCGFATIHRSVLHKPTLAQWLKETKEDRTAGRVFLLCAGRHWQLISGRKYACGKIGRIVGLSDKRIKKRVRVISCHEVIPRVDSDRKTVTRAYTSKAKRLVSNR